MFGLFVRKHAEAVGLFADVATLYVVSDKNINKIELTQSMVGSRLEVIVYFPALHGHSFRSVKLIIQYLLAYIKGFKVLHKEWGKPDLIQVSVFTRTAVIALIYKFLYRKPYFVIEHWTRYLRDGALRNIFHSLASRISAHYASGIMPVTYQLKKCMLDHKMYNKNYIVINNVVEDLFFRSRAPKIDINDKKIILNVTCFDDNQKNLTGLLRIIKSLKDNRDDFLFYLIGDGNDFEIIKNYAKKLGLTDAELRFTGVLEGEELVDYFYKSSFSVLFSNYENMPVVISESLVCGKPFISTNVGGIGEHIDDNNGILVHPKNEDEMYEAITYMLDHLQNYNQQEIAQKALHKYDYQSVGKSIIDIYKSALDK
jgi:glycosyltransferase involved in cell wall biosynthesis